MRSLLLLPAVIAALAACGRRQSPPPTAPLPEPQAERAATPDRPRAEVTEPPQTGEPPEMPEEATAPVIVTIPGTEDVTISVLAAGRGTRAPLRYAAPDGASERFQIEVASRMKAPGVPPALPTLNMTYTARVSEAPDEAMRVVLRLDEASASEAEGATLVEQMDEAMRGLAGTTVEATVTPTGRVGEQTFTAPPAAHDQRGLVSSLGQYLTWPVIVPDEPLGVGARWQVVQEVDLGGIPATATTVYTLRERRDGRLRIEGTIAVRTEETSVGDVAIERFEGNGRRTFEVAEGQLFGASTLTQDVTLAMQSQGQPIELSVGWTITTTPLAAEPATTSAR